MKAAAIEMEDPFGNVFRPAIKDLLFESSEQSVIIWALPTIWYRFELGAY